MIKTFSVPYGPRWLCALTDPISSVEFSSIRELHFSHGVSVPTKTVSCCIPRRNILSPYFPAFAGLHPTSGPEVLPDCESVWLGIKLWKIIIELIICIETGREWFINPSSITSEFSVLCVCLCSVWSYGAFHQLHLAHPLCFSLAVLLDIIMYFLFPLYCLVIFSGPNIRLISGFLLSCVCTSCRNNLYNPLVNWDLLALLGSGFILSAFVISYFSTPKCAQFVNKALLFSDYFLFLCEVLSVDLFASCWPHVGSVRIRPDFWRYYVMPLSLSTLWVCFKSSSL